MAKYLFQFSVLIDFELKGSENKLAIFCIYASSFSDVKQKVEKKIFDDPDAKSLIIHKIQIAKNIAKKIRFDQVPESTYTYL